MPAVYPGRHFVTGGGLISYEPDYIDQYQRAAGYVSRILKGEKPGDLPVQAPTKYELVINMKTDHSSRCSRQIAINPRTVSFDALEDQNLLVPVHPFNLAGIYQRIAS